MRDRYFYLAFLLVFASGFFLRFYDLEARPMHHDEGVIGWFQMNVLKGCLTPHIDLGDPLGSIINFLYACGSSYRYDPDYHGPFEYITGAWFFAAFGVSDYTLRAPGCLFNAATLCLLLFLRRPMGDVGVLASAMILASSPSMTYFSQRAYQENFFMFFVLLAVVCAVKLAEGRGDKWLYLGVADMALLFAIKESAYIFTAIGVSFLVLWVLINFSLFNVRGRSRFIKTIRRTASQYEKQIRVSLILFGFIYAFFYSNMFTDGTGLQKGVTHSLSFWISRSTSWESHFKPFGYYLGLLYAYEPVALLMALFSLACLKGSFSKWCAWWTSCTIIIYSLISYKTPWLLVSLVLPMAVLGGCGIECVSNRLSGWLKAILILAILPLLAYSTYLAWDLTHVRYADRDMGLFYVAGLESYDDLVARTEGLAANMDGKNTEIKIMVQDYWPLPWSLREYRLIYNASNASSPIVLSSDGNFSDISKDLRGSYAKEGRYEVWPGHYAYLYYRKDYKPEKA